jgi:hypothetical protein
MNNRRQNDSNIEHIEKILESHRLLIDENTKVLNEHISKEAAFQNDLTIKLDKLVTTLEPVIILIADAQAVSRIKARVKSISIWATITVAPFIGMLEWWKHFRGN